MFLLNFRLEIFLYSNLDIDLHELISEPSNHATTLVPRNVIDDIQRHSYRSGITSLQILEEDYITLRIGLFFDEFSPFFEVYNEVQFWLESNGVMEKWRRDITLRKSKQEELGPQVLTMDHLAIGFLACLIPAILSVVAFVGELAWSESLTAFKKRCHSKIENHLKSIVNLQPAVESQQTLVDEHILENLDEILIVKPFGESEANLVVDEIVLEKIIVEEIVVDDFVVEENATQDLIVICSIIDELDSN